MHINWHGQSCFQLTTNQAKNSQVNIVIDPFSEKIGLRFPRWSADIVLISHHHPDYSNDKAVKGDPFVIDGPGEYEIKNIYIQGIALPEKSSADKIKTIYTIEAEDLNICHLGAFNNKELAPEQVERIGEVDILLIPVGGQNTIASKEALKIMSQIEPSIIIPMHYHLPKLKSSAGKLEGLDKLLKAMGIKKIDALPKLLIKKKDIVPEEAKIIVLNP